MKKIYSFLTGYGSVLRVVTLAVIVSLTSLPFVGCSASTVAQDIVNWTPAAQSAVAAFAVGASAVYPEAAEFAPIFNVASNALVVQAKAYLANPSQSVLAALQTQVTTFQQQVNAALLSAAKVTNPASQQKMTADIGAIATILNAMLALIQTIKGAPALTTTQSAILRQSLELANRQQAVAMVQQHYDLTAAEAQARVEVGTARLQVAAGI